MGCPTAPTTVMGLLFRSLTLRLTSAWETKPLDSKISEIFCSAWTSVQSGDVQANRNEGDADGAGLADAHYPAELFYIENLEVQQVAVADDVVMRHHPRGGGHRTYAVVDLLWRLKNGLLSATEWHQNQ